METLSALGALAALSQETRLNVFRLLVKAGREGMLAGELSSALSVRTNTMSANLAVLLSADLVRNERQGRTIRYFANFEAIRALLGFIMEDCCGGRPSLCRPLLDEIACSPESAAP
ncbi:MAG: helix-turn-helix domain-containing protein [Pseudomonadota bacterium]